MKVRHIILFILLTFFALVPNLSIYGEEGPPYAKWGRMAMAETKEKYPEADIVDYLHIGRETKGEQSIEKFKLWLRGQEREFGVFVDIVFETETEKVLSITFRETDQ